jgi:regulator of CtrA degradation
MTKTANTSQSPVFIGSRLADSSQFKALHAEGMALVEEVSLYLDTKGKLDARGLSHANALSYAAESMRLTTRLMQLASWLMLQRGLNEGEFSNDEAQHQKSKLRLSGMGPATPSAILSELPLDLQKFITRTQSIFERITNLNKYINAPQQLNGDKNQVLVEQLARLHRNFG